jgi:hypothetical protein
MPATCYSVLRGKRIRVTDLSACGEAPAPSTANSMIVSSGFITVQFAPVYKDATEYEQVDADDNLCVNEMGRKQLKRVEFTISFCNVDPELVTLFTGNPVEVDNAGNSVGFRLSEDAAVADFAFELWSGIGNQPCDESGNTPYGYFLLPWATDATLNDHTVENGVTNFEITGRTEHNALWGQGPYNVVRDAGGVPTALDDPILPGEHYLQRFTTLAPPAAVCGLQAMPAAPTLPS